MVPYDIQPSRGGYLFGALLMGDIRKLRPDLMDGILSVKGVWIGCDAPLPQRTDFIESGLVKCNSFRRVSHENAPGYADDL